MPSTILMGSDFREVFYRGAPWSVANEGVLIRTSHPDLHILFHISCTELARLIVHNDCYIIQLARILDSKISLLAFAL